MTGDLRPGGPTTTGCWRTRWTSPTPRSYMPDRSATPIKPQIHDFDLDRRARQRSLWSSVTATVDLDPPRTLRHLVEGLPDQEASGPPVSTTTGFYPPNVSLLIVRPPHGRDQDLHRGGAGATSTVTVSKFCMLRDVLHRQAGPTGTPIKRTHEDLRRRTGPPWRASARSCCPSTFPPNCTSSRTRSSWPTAAGAKSCLDRGLGPGRLRPGPRPPMRAAAVIPSPARSRRRRRLGQG